VKKPDYVDTLFNCEVKWLSIAGETAIYVDLNMLIKNIKMWTYAKEIEIVQHSTALTLALNCMLI
jgi:hypothetical protein